MLFNLIGNSNQKIFDMVMKRTAFFHSVMEPWFYIKNGRSNKITACQCKNQKSKQEGDKSTRQEITSTETICVCWIRASYENVRKYALHISGIISFNDILFPIQPNFSYWWPFWLLVNSMCNRGHTAKAAISLIYEVYGESQPVSYILKRIRKDKGKNPLFHATVN